MMSNDCQIQRFLANIVQSGCVVLNALALKRIARKRRVPKKITHYYCTLYILLLSLPLQQLQPTAVPVVEHFETQKRGHLMLFSCRSSRNCPCPQETSIGHSS